MIAGALFVRKVFSTSSQFATRLSVDFSEDEVLLVQVSSDG